MLGIFFPGIIGIAMRKFKHLFQTFDILLFFISVDLSEDWNHQTVENNDPGLLIFMALHKLWVIIFL